METLITQSLTLVVLIYLLLGIKLTCKGLFKLILFMQIAFEFLLTNSWQDRSTYEFIKSISENDHLNAIIFIGIAILFLDLPSLFFNRGKIFKYSFSFGMNQNFARNNRSFAISMLLFGIGVKFAELASSGILFGRDVSTYKPEDSVGLYFLSIADFLIPFSLALLYYPGKSKFRFPVLEIALLLFISYFSFSKAAILIYLSAYIPALGIIFGIDTLKKIFLKPIIIPIIIGIILFFGIKTQQRYNIPELALQPDVLVEYALDGVGSRFGLIYRTFIVINREIQVNEKQLLNGYYNSQIFYLWIPRFLWSDKPRVASELLYDYLGVTEENYGTAFAINVFGTFLVDFGAIIALLFALLLGFVLYFGDRLIEKLVLGNASVLQVFISLVWINFSFSLSEGGIPPGFTKAVILFAAFFLVSFLHLFIFQPIFKFLDKSKTPVVKNANFSSRSVIFNEKK